MATVTRMRRVYSLNKLPFIPTVCIANFILLPFNEFHTTGMKEKLIQPLSREPSTCSSFPTALGRRTFSLLAASSFKQTAGSKAESGERQI